MKHLSHACKEKLVKCECGRGGVQDIEHILTDCGLTEDAVGTALTAVEEIRGETAAATVESRLRAAFRQMGYDSDSERKARKVLGKLHDDIRRVLSDQRAAIQTHAALPI